MVKGVKFLKYSKIHFVGIGGISMNCLAKYCLVKKKIISGSDTCVSPLTKELQTRGVKVYLGHHASAVYGKDLVVYTSAVSENNVELLAAKKLNIPIVKRSEFLGEILKGYKNSIAISGCHGKTTTTAMLSNILIEAGVNPTVFLGGECADFGNFRVGKKDCAVVEACEYKKNFLRITHNISVVLNVDTDHLDSYNGMDDLIETFKRFVGDSISFINADDKNARLLSNKTTVTFGIENSAMFWANSLRKKGERYSFDFYAYTQKKGRINLKVLGRFNVYNALAAATVAYSMGIEFLYIKRGLEKFSGVKRRNEFLGNVNGTQYIADYAHHPKEILETASALCAYDEKTLMVFQPHTYSRTKNLLNEFINVLKDAKNLIIYKTYSARESFDFLGSAENLFQKLRELGVNVEYAKTPDNLYEIMKNKYKNMEKVIFFGAGDIYDLANNFVQNNL